MKEVSNLVYREVYNEAADVVWNGANEFGPILEVRSFLTRKVTEEPVRRTASKMRGDST